MNCPECRSTKVVRMGFIVTRNGKKQRYRCNRCGRTFYSKKPKGQSSKTQIAEVKCGT